MGYTHKQLEDARAEREAARQRVRSIKKELKSEEDPYYRGILQQELDEAIFDFRSADEYVDDIIIDLCAPKPL